MFWEKMIRGMMNENSRDTLRDAESTVINNKDMH